MRAIGQGPTPLLGCGSDRDGSTELLRVDEVDLLDIIELC